MAQERPLTPEKQLLNLIESGQGKAAPAVDPGTIRRNSLSFLSFGAWKGRVSFFRENFRKQFAGFSFRQLDIKAVNAVLGGIAFFLLLYLVGNSIVSVIGLKKNPAPGFKPGTTAGTELSREDRDFKNSVSAYLEKIRIRDIFTLGESTAASVNESKGPSSRIIEATAHLRLVGISWSNDPDAMIEDTKALRTFFAKRGQMIGRIRVQAILKDKVILSYAGEEIELK